MSSSKLPNNGYKFYIVTNIVFILLLLWCLFIYGCASSKQLENSHTTENKTEQKSDTTKVTIINNAVLDTLKIKVAKVKTSKPECDSITQATLDQVLRQLNSRKKSGDNESGIYYNEIKGLIIAWQKMAQTKNVNTATNNTHKQSSIDKSVKYIPVKYIPLWVKILAWIGFLSTVFILYRVSRIWV